MITILDIPDGTANRLMEIVLRAHPDYVHAAIDRVIRDAYAEGFRHGAAHVLAVRELEGDLPVRVSPS